MHAFCPSTKKSIEYAAALWFVLTFCGCPIQPHTALTCGAVVSEWRDRNVSAKATAVFFFFFTHFFYLLYNTFFADGSVCIKLTFH